ncbi:MAG: 50S ribosomal protein L17 [Bdellovibrionaceae bacterium]|nr:50S ribosomal protein L17 [Bdellovibrionales bacterium]MCB9084647.1 50S ribosomal protein L17 [Pseudobdellovibrionaceae bacterium]
MRHKVDKATFGRKQGPRVALMRGLVNSLVMHGRIKTTLPKAKELRRHVEKAVTMGKKGTLHARRTLASRYPNKDTVKALVDDLGVRFKARPGGYTKIIKLGFRPGDKAEMAYIQFVDFTAPEVAGEETVKGDAGAKKREKMAVRGVAKSRKKARKVQSKSRQANRPA